MTAQTQAKTNRMCDAALEHIQGVADDMGIGEALNVYRAQTAAFKMLLNRHLGSTELARVAVYKLVADLLVILP